MAWSNSIYREDLILCGILMEASGKCGLDKSVAGHSPSSLPIGSDFGGSIRPVLLLSNSEVNPNFSSHLLAGSEEKPYLCRR